MVKSRWCDYSNAYIFGGEAITVVGQGVGAATIASDKNNKYLKTVDHLLIASAK